MYFGILLVIHLISPRAMGFGDVKLAAVMGLYLGWLAAGYATVVRAGGVGARHRRAGRVDHRDQPC